MKSIPRTSGIYLITCTTTYKVYVGSSQDMQKRWHAHRQLLRAAKHENIHLQRAWNKYGEAAFKVEVLEEVEQERLLEREKYWMDFYHTADPSRAFNIALYPRDSMRGRTHKPKTIALFRAARKGELNANYRGKTRICQNCGMVFKSKARDSNQKYCSHSCYSKAPKSDEHRYKMGNAMRGKHRTPESLDKFFGKRASWYIFTDPNGVEILAQGLAKFCREHGLDQPSLSKVIRGQQKSHKGWRCRKANPPE